MTAAGLPHPSRRGIRSTLVGIVINAALATVKALAGYFGHSYALIADAIESFSDIFSSTIVFLGLRFAAKPPDADHPYGHGKFESLAASVVALMLLGAAILIAVESVREIVTPHHAPASFTLLVLIAVVIIKETLFRFVISVGQELGSTAVQADAWHHRSDAITSAAAFVGITIALIGGPGYESADDFAALLASGIIAYNGSRLLIHAVRELLDAAPSKELETAVRAIAGRIEGVAGLEKCLVRKLGIDLFVDIHVEVSGDLSVREGHQIAHRVKDGLILANPRIRDVLVHIEPAKDINRQQTD